MTQIKVYGSTPQSSGSDAAKGSVDNPYTEAEYEAMLENDTWPGGYVEGLGYCGKAVIVTASYPDSDSMGSDDSWPSEDSYDDPWGSDGNENDTDNSSTGGNHGGQGGNTGGGEYVGGGHSGGGGGNSNNPYSIFNGQNCTFLYGKPFYTEREMETMRANGTWKGGNVFTLGYVGIDYVINANIPSLDIDYDILDVCSEYYREFEAKARDLIKNALDLAKSKIEDCCNNLMKSPFAQAVNRYNSSTGEPLYLDVHSLGLEQHIRRFHLVADSSNSSKYHINLLEFNKFCSIVDGCTLPETVKIFNTAITLGNITLTEVSENTFTIDRDEYNFEMHPWEDECVRNILTLIGEKVNEGIGISANGLQHLIHGKILGRGTDVIDGNVRRHINGQNKSFYIYFNGTITIQP